VCVGGGPASPERKMRISMSYAIFCKRNCSMSSNKGDIKVFVKWRNDWQVHEMERWNEIPCKMLNGNVSFQKKCVTWWVTQYFEIEMIVSALVLEKLGILCKGEGRPHDESCSLWWAEFDGPNRTSLWSQIRELFTMKVFCAKCGKVKFLNEEVWKCFQTTYIVFLCYSEVDLVFMKE